MKYKLYEGDCLKMMDKLIEEGIKVDMILTDPPYGTTACKWDIVIPFNKYIVIKEGKKDKILYKDEFMLRKFKEGINIKESSREDEWYKQLHYSTDDEINRYLEKNGLYYSIEHDGRYKCEKILIDYFVDSNIDVYKI